MSFPPLTRSPGFREFAAEATCSSLGARFEQAVRDYAGRLAVCERDGRETIYAELNERANAIAHAILERLPADQPERILVLAHGGVDGLAALFGVWKSGHCVVAIDPYFPAERSRMVAEQSQAALVIRESAYADLARQVVNGAMPLIEIEHAYSGSRRENPGVAVAPEALACLVYTSGSTGMPKGAMHTHHSLLHICCRRTNLQGIGPDDRMTLLYANGVMAALYGITTSLLNGASLHPFDLRDTGFDRLIPWLVAHEITHYHSVASVFRELAAVCRGSVAGHRVRQVTFGGERVLWSDVQRARKLFGDRTEFFTGLGASETGTVCHLPITPGVDLDELIVPIGRPVDGVEVLLLDENGVPVPPGEIGEITIRSQHIGIEYWNNQDATGRAFSRDPDDPSVIQYRMGDLGRLREDGLLEHCGRRDHQVKIRGFRVELGEIEARLLEHPAVADAVVSLQPAVDEDILVAYVVFFDGESLDIDAIRAFLRGRLPNHMLPVGLVHMERLPRTSTNKVDRHALPAFVAPEQAGAVNEFDIEQDEADPEALFCAICEEVLGREVTNLDANFIDLGGDSITAMRLASRLQEYFGGEVGVRMLLGPGSLRQVFYKIAAEGTL